MAVNKAQRAAGQNHQYNDNGEISQQDADEFIILQILPYFPGARFFQPFVQLYPHQKHPSSLPLTSMDHLLVLSHCETCMLLKRTVKIFRVGIPDHSADLIGVVFPLSEKLHRPFHPAIDNVVDQMCIRDSPYTAWC